MTLLSKKQEYIQLRLFPLTFEEVVKLRIDEFDRKIRDIDRKTIDKTERLRKGQFAKIGSLEKRYSDLEDRLAIIEKGICEMMKKNDEVVLNPEWEFSISAIGE